MTISQQEFEAILADDTKRITGNIVWGDDIGHYPAREFRAEIRNDGNYSMFIVGEYIPFSGKLSYSLILRGTGRIYGLDLGAAHRNPDGEMVRGNKHKNYWKDGYRDRFAYIPEDITATWDQPVEAWHQFCAEANLNHQGIMRRPDEPRYLPI